jgi:hypothetical protein
MVIPIKSAMMSCVDAIMSRAIISCAEDSRASTDAALSYLSPINTAAPCASFFNYSVQQ